MEEKITFASYLKELRNTKKMTLKELATKSETSDSYLSQLENGKRNPPKPKLLKNIATALGGDDKREAVEIYIRLSGLAGYDIEEDISFTELSYEYFNFELSQEINNMFKDDARAVSFMRLCKNFYQENNNANNNNVTFLLSILSGFEIISNSADSNEIEMTSKNLETYFNLLLDSVKNNSLA